MTVHVVGLDGADWELIRHLVDQGELPAFRTVLEEGATGDLESTHPPITCPAWQSYATGKNPGKLGMYGWMQFERETTSISFKGSAIPPARSYFEVLSEAGYRVGVVNMPTTYPADPYEGIYLVAGPSGQADERYTSPEQLRHEIAEVVPDYRVEPEETLSEVSRDDLSHHVKRHFEQRFSIAEWLRDEKGCDLIQTTVFGTDTLQHYYWDDEAVLREAYSYIDDWLCNLLDCDDTEAVFLMSDHGFGALHISFAPNQWLLEQGYLSVDIGASTRAMGRIGLTRDRLKQKLLDIGLLGLARSLVPVSIRRRWLPNAGGSMKLVDVDVDWDATRAVSLGHGPIFVNDKAFSSNAAREAYTDHLEEELLSVQSPEGDLIIEDILRPDDIYVGHGEEAPDLLVQYAPGVDASSVAVGCHTFGDLNSWAACHRQNGIFAAHGENIANTSVHLSITDLAPTIMHYLGEPIPSDMDGNAKRNVFTGPPASRSVDMAEPAGERDDVSAEGEADSVEARLDELGYLG